MGRLFLWGSSGYLLGNLLVNTESHLFFSWCFLLAAGGVAAAFLTHWRRVIWLGFALVTMILGYGVVKQTVIRWEGLPQEFSETIKVLVVHREAPQLWSQPLVVKPLDTTTVATQILWRAPRTTQVTPGTVLLLECTFRRPENFQPAFDYQRYLATKNIGYLCEQERSVTILPESSFWHTKLFTWQRVLRERVYVFLTDPTAGLLQGLFLGGDDGLSSGLRDTFRRAGLSHIVAVSGYNMSLVAMAVLFLALFAGLWRKTATLFAVTGIFIFLLLIDTSAASLRAALMAWIGFGAFFLGRPLHPFNGLLFAALLMAIFRPLIVRYDVGFQLSFLATLMLLIASPWLEQLVRRGWWWSWGALFLSTLVIEIGIFPVIAFHFGMVSLLAPLANVMVLPLIPLVMALGFTMLLLGSIMPFLGVLIAFPTWFILSFLIWISEWVGSFSWGIIETVTFSETLLFGWYIVLAGMVWYSRKLFQRYVLWLDH